MIRSTRHRIRARAVANSAPRVGAFTTQWHCRQVLFATIRAAADRIAQSRLFHDNGGVGLIVVQGRHALTDVVLAETALAKFVLCQHVSLCMERTLISRRDWKPTDDQADDWVGFRVAGRQAEPVWPKNMKTCNKQNKEKPQNNENNKNTKYIENPKTPHH